jgi:hypothetical protein
LRAVGSVPLPAERSTPYDVGDQGKKLLTGNACCFLPVSDEVSKLL